MSDCWIVLIPTDPAFIPDSWNAKAALDRFRSIVPNALKIESTQTETIEFFDCGANFHKVTCPECSNKLSISWWQDRMDEEAETGFDLRRHTLPCCNSKKNLNELNYDLPQGFAKFSLEAMTLEIQKISERDKEMIEKELGCELRQILQHL